MAIVPAAWRSRAWSLGLLLTLLNTVPAWSAPARVKRASGSLEAIRTLTRAENLIHQLEYSRAKELLETLLQEPRTRSFHPPLAAKIWVTLGRARAELGDRAGMQGAFREAVRLDPEIQLPASISPKIRAALTEAHNAAEPVEEGHAREVRSHSIRMPSNGRRPPKRSANAALSAHFYGRRVVGGNVHLVVEHTAVPLSATIEARIRRGATWEVIPLTRTGTIASGDIRLNGPRLEAYVVARQNAFILAKAGSVEQPLTLETEGLPSLEWAWSAPDPEGARQTAPVASSTVAGSDLLFARPPLHRAAEPLARDLPSHHEVWLFIGGGAGLVIIAVAIALLAGGKTCEAKEGFGCTEIVVQPLRLR